MAITYAERQHIIELAVFEFAAFPGGTYLSEIVSMFESNGRDLLRLADLLDDTGVYESLNPATQTLCAFAHELLAPWRLQADSAAVDFVASRWLAGESKGQIACEAIQALHAITPADAPQYLDAQAMLSNKTVYAEYWSVTLGNSSTDIAVLRDAFDHWEPSNWIEDPIGIVGVPAALPA